MKIYYILLLLIFFLAGILRFYDISNNPPGLYIDEVSIGNNAYSILKTGKDENGQNFPLFFRSFGDYKMPLYIYSVAFSMSIFGKNELAVRFPSALAGTLTVLVLYFLLKELLELDKSKFLGKRTKYLPIVSALFLAISIWHIQFSRAGFEVNLGVFFFLFASLLSALYLKKRNFTYLLTGILFYIFAIYTYHVFRFVSPVTMVSLFSAIFWKIPRERIKLASLGLFCILLMLPILEFSLTANGLSRFSQASAFVEYSAPSLLQKIKIYPMVFLKNYFSYFSFDYLFSFGDGIGRHQIPDFGLLPIWQFPLVLVGLYALIKKKKSYLKYFILGILIFSPVIASIARPSPHSLRNLLSVIPFITLSSIGIIFLLNKTKKWYKLSFILLSIIATYYFLLYLNFYYTLYPKTNILDWGGGYKQVVEEASSLDKKYFKIVIDEKLNNSMLYFNFYNSSISPKSKLIKENWKKPKEWGNKPVLYIRPYYGRSSTSTLIKNIFLPNQNHDIFAQFWGI